MNREEKIKDIIDELFYKDIAGIIESFLFVKCKECDTECLEDNMKESFDNNFYCYRCIKKSYIRKCCKCFKYYSANADGIFICSICLRMCCIYCSKCFKHNKINLHTYYDNHYSFYWARLNEIEIDLDYYIDN